METPGLTRGGDPVEKSEDENEGSDEGAPQEGSTGVVNGSQSGATSPLRDSVSSKPNSPVYAAGVLPGGGAREKHVIEESDEILSVQVTQFQVRNSDLGWNSLIKILRENPQTFRKINWKFIHDWLPTEIPRERI